MSKFHFRLGRVLDLRREEEKSAKERFMEARARRIEAEFDLEGVNKTRQLALNHEVSCLESMRALDSYLAKLEDEVQHINSAIGVLVDEENAAKNLWIQSKQDADALQKLHDAEFEEWRKDEARREQNELDEWATTRRAA